MDEYVPFALADEERSAQFIAAARRRERRRIWRNVRIALGLGLVAFLALFPLGVLPVPQLPGWVLALGEPSAPASTDAPVSPVAPDVPADALAATVDYVHDGDTLFLFVDGAKVKVRLIGMDTPEIGDNAECFGNEATAYLRGLLPVGSKVSIMSDIEKRDQYDRSLFYLWADDGTFVNLSLLESGAGEFVVYEPNVRYSAEFAAAELTARDAGLGLWGACG
ncbi:thermonuclease [Glaciihabitans arcticus]|uniref:Thermonuclease n=1 Tax=Glaciihabitans arcticus TaxID=2668039 RepID=A0A4Q9GS82_9MICO|nr:thermonuclease family protein [Glaciihabitans arcticus]TBN57435.1 thermonuclease [Glaciihabitans arcticus]